MPPKRPTRRPAPLLLREIAERVGVTREALSLAIKDGRIPSGCYSRAENGRYQFTAEQADLAIAHYLANTNSAMQRDHGTGAGAEGGVGSGATPGYAASRAAREHYQAEMARLELEEKLGTLLDLEQTRATVFNAARAVRNKMGNLSARLAPLLAAETDQHKCATILDDEVDAVLRELADAFEQLVGS